MIKWFKDIFIGSRFLAASAIIVFLFAVSYSLPWLFPIAQGFLIIFGLLIFSEFWMLFNGGIDVKAVRTLPEMFSLGDENPIDIVVSNQSDMALDIELIDELPYQFQERNLTETLTLASCKSREMMMPFNGMSLLDYSINTALAISNIALHKYDKMGLITFSDKIGTTLKASGNKLQLKKIVRALYNEKERDTEANYELLYRSLSMIAKTRALLFLFINFESMYALERALPILRRINKRHLLVIVFFRNTEIEEYEKKVPLDIRGIYQQTIAKKLNNEKMAILSKLRQANIQSVLTTPDDLSMDTINKYLELKSRGKV